MEVLARRSLDLSGVVWREDEAWEAEGERERELSEDRHGRGVSGRGWRVLVSSRRVMIRCLMVPMSIGAEVEGSCGGVIPVVV